MNKLGRGDVSTRTYHSLWNANRLDADIEAICACTERQLLKIEGIGRVGVKEIREFLHGIGRSLAVEVPRSSSRIHAAVAAERERCAKIAEERAAEYDAEEKGCWNDGESAANALREIAAKIRGGQ